MLFHLVRGLVPATLFALARGFFPIGLIILGGQKYARDLFYFIHF